MAAGNSVNDEIREQHAKMKGKPFKVKLAYFWEYYKVHTLIAVIAVLVISNLVYTMATRKDIVLEAAFVNTFLKEEPVPEQMASDFTVYAEADPSQYETTINTNMYVDYENMDQYSAANMQKLLAMTSAKALDIIVTDDSYLNHNIEVGMFGDLTLFLPQELLSQYEDKLLYADLPDDDKGEVPIAIDIRDSKYFMSNEVSSWFTVVANCDDPALATSFFEFMMEP